MRALAVIPQRHWLVASGFLSGSWLEGQDFSFEGVCSLRGTGSWFLAPLVFARSTVRMRNTGALGGRATRTADKKIRPMGPIVSLALPPPSWLKKRRAGLFSKLY